MMNEHAPPLPLGMSVDTAVETLSVSRTKIYGMLSTGELESRTIGRRRIILAESVHHLLMGRPHQIKARACLRAEVGHPKEVAFLRQMLAAKYPSEAQLAWIEKIHGRI